MIDTIFARSIALQAAQLLHQTIMLVALMYSIGIVMHVIGIMSSNHCNNYNNRKTCVVVVKEGFVQRVRKEQILTSREEEQTMILCYFSEGINHCCVGFFRKTYYHHDEYDVILIQVTDIYFPSNDDHIRRQKYHCNMLNAEASAILALPGKNNCKNNDEFNIASNQKKVKQKSNKQYRDST